MRDNTLYRGQTVLGKTINMLAARPQGTNSIEVYKACGLKANSILHAWFRKGYIHRTEESTGTMACAYQFFLNPEDRDAWQALPMDKRPNCARKRNNHKGSKPRRAMLKPLNRMQLGTWARAPKEGAPIPKKQVVRTQGLALGWDCRYQMAPQAAVEFEGEFQKEWKRLRGET